MPEAGRASSILVLGVEATLQRNLTRALKTSRDLFRDLVLCSSDFAWGNGPPRRVRVCGASRRGRFMRQKALHGRSVFSLLSLERGGDEKRDPTRLSGQRGARRRRSLAVGGRWSIRCFLVSAVPVYDAGNLWCGGARRRPRRHRTTLAGEGSSPKNKARSELIRNIVDTIRKEMDPIRMLQVTAETIGTACRAASCWVLETDDGMHYETIGRIPRGR